MRSLKTGGADRVAKGVQKVLQAKTAAICHLECPRLSFLRLFFEEKKEKMCIFRAWRGGYYGMRFASL
jgi:hypothetical protein